MTDRIQSNVFIYVTYIRTTPEKLWDALTKPEFTRVYWHPGVRLDSSWEQGASWKMLFGDGTVADTGEVLEVDRPRRLVLKWRNEFRPELKAEGYCRCTFELEPQEPVVKLTITHEFEDAQSKLLQGVATGWPKILSSLKSYLETGTPLGPAKG